MVSREGGGGLLHVVLINSIFIHPRCLSQNKKNRKAIDLSLASGQTTHLVYVVRTKKHKNIE